METGVTGGVVVSPTKNNSIEARDVIVIGETSRAFEKTTSVPSPPADIEGKWRDVSPSKHRWQGIKPAAEHTTVISPSRFAVLLEQGNNDELEGKDGTEERDGSNDEQRSKVVQMIRKEKKVKS
ncbi:hypothetical protein F2Q69_00035934 [Brassica cretica]|uniref:Uncharacterized protein n=1 Tax=Brassica cretica TaxID=69181 RepID=A0A8S9SNG9_BRACR|nr:hypothetical protein F2Q69_00035934 [Brassica cretica]